MEKYLYLVLFLVFLLLGILFFADNINYDSGNITIVKNSDYNDVNYIKDTNFLEDSIFDLNSEVNTQKKPKDLNIFEKNVDINSDNNLDKNNFLIVDKNTLNIVKESKCDFFKDISSNHYNIFSWPLKDFIVSSGFGPRIKISENNRDDFHLGIDLIALSDDNVYLVYDGVIYNVYSVDDNYNPYPVGGNVIIVKHELPFYVEYSGVETNIIYSLYMHLDKMFFSF